MEQVSGHPQRNGRGCILGNVDHEGNIDVFGGGSLDLCQGVGTLGHKRALLKGLVSAVHGVGDQVVSPGQKPLDQKFALTVGQGLDPSRRDQHVLDRLSTLGIADRAGDAPGCSREGGIVPAGDDIVCLAGRLDAVQAIAHRPPIGNVFLGQRLTLAGIAVLDHRAHRQWQPQHIAIFPGLVHDVLLGVERQPGDLIEDAQEHGLAGRRVGGDLHVKGHHGQVVCFGRGCVGWGCVSRGGRVWQVQLAA